MSIDYTKLFTVIGKHVKHANAMFAHVDQLDEFQTNLEYSFDQAGIEVVLDDLPDAIDGMQDSITAWITGNVKSMTDRVLLDEEILVDELVFSETPTIRTVLEKLHDQMVEEDESIEGSSTVTNGIIDTPGTSSTNTLAVAPLSEENTLHYLDGVSSPAADIPAFRGWAGRVTNLVGSLTVRAKCIADSESNNTARGSELFQIEGGANRGYYSRHEEGAGQITVPCATNQSVIPAGKFDSWANQLPNGWTLHTGVLDDFQQNTNGLRGTSCLELIGGGAAVALRQSLSAASFQRRRAYWLWFVVKRSGVVSSAILSFKLYNGATPIGFLGVSEAELTTSWALWHTPFVVPAELGTNVFIEVSSVGITGANILIDDFCIAPVSYFGGIGMGAAALDTKILIGDLAFDTSVVGVNGTFSEYFRKLYRFQLPHDGSPTIVDSLAE